MTFLYLKFTTFLFHELYFRNYLISHAFHYYKLFVLNFVHFVFIGIVIYAGLEKCCLVMKTRHSVIMSFHYRWLLIL